VIGLRSKLQAWRAIAMTLVLVALSGCVSVSYQTPGQHIVPRDGETLVFGRLRFFHDEREFFPWSTTFLSSLFERGNERHLWLLRLGRRAVSAEVHPDSDGSLAIWLAAGDYALIGSTQPPASGSAAYEVVAVIRVPAEPVAAYAGELIMKTESREGLHPSYSGFGAKSVTLLPIDIARATLDQRLGTLPEPPFVSPWCAGDDVPGFNDPGLARRAKELLDGGCRDQH